MIITRSASNWTGWINRRTVILKMTPLYEREAMNLEHIMTNKTNKDKHKAHSSQTYIAILWMEI